MAIKFTKYVDIVSGVGGGAAVRQRDLIGRLFTINNLLPPGSFVEFSDAESVGDYFGTSSEEYLRALFYFSWISKNIQKAQKISFARWVNADVAPRVYGAPGAQSVAAWTPITNGSFTLKMGEQESTLSAINFSSAASLNDVASAIQTKINAVVAGGTLWTAATVTWDAVRKSFNLVGGEVGEADIQITAGTGGSDIAAQLGWLSINTILADGADTASLTDTLNESANGSNNFGSFLFLPTLTDEQATEIAEWNDSQNVLYQFMLRTDETSAEDLYGLIKDYGGVAMTLAPIPTQYPEMCPMIILAATDYSKRNSVQNYMYQQFPGLSASVSETSISDQYDAVRCNYYGVTQTAGQFLAFYQRGVLMGQATDPVDQNVYANEQWLKDAAGAAIMEILLSLSRISANSQGRAQIMTTLQSVIDQALFNGTISVGKALNNTQKLYIGQITGDDLAWHQVQNIGYWLDCVMQPVETQDNRVEYKAVYTLIYSKDDAIRKVDGTHILI